VFLVNEQTRKIGRAPAKSLTTVIPKSERSVGLALRQDRLRSASSSQTDHTHCVPWLTLSVYISSSVAYGKIVLITHPHFKLFVFPLHCCLVALTTATPRFCSSLGQRRPKIMAQVVRALLKAFRRKKAPPLACHLSLDHDDEHIHTAACFLDVQPLALVELFQSQSCQSCPPAVPGILEATQHPNLQHVTYDVTYFDHLGWKDTHSNPRWDQRQKNYVRKWGRSTLYTPMVVVNGVVDAGSGGGSRAEIDGVVQRAREIQHRQNWHIYLDTNDTHVKVDTDRLEAEPHDVSIIVYRTTTEVVKIVSRCLFCCRT